MKYLCHLYVTTELRMPRKLQGQKTERRGRVANTHASYSGGPGFKSRPRRPALLTEVFRGFPQSLQVSDGIVP
jgi:hypothetical protein